MEYTPAPWLLIDLGDKWDLITDRRHPNGVNWIATIISGYDGDEANANLIAASPDLLAICKKMESFINNLPDGGDYELVEEAQRAIEKAE